MSCSCCNKSFGWFSSGYVCPNPSPSPSSKSAAADAPDGSESQAGSSPGCGKRFCAKCANYALVTEHDAKMAEKTEDYAHAQVTTLCKECFKRNSPLDYTSADGPAADGVDVIEPVSSVNGSAPSVPTTIFWAHGGGGCRLMFNSHAHSLASMGYRSVLFDFPGHGRLMDVPLSMESVVERIVKVVATYGDTREGARHVYVGGSLGGYIGMEMLALNPTLFDAAVISMCGQNVGHGAGLAARWGLSLLALLSSYLSSSTILTTMRSTFAANGHMDHKLMMDAGLRTGFYFDQNVNQIEILRQTDSAAALAKYPRPVLFVNGSKDHSDSENKWLEVSNTANGGKSKLVVYKGGDHGFSHDKRFKDEFTTEIKTFFETAAVL
ncbi:hypothetical protein HDU93_009981 [Gonapodya sp. JEL0774]|nr:hypothetical protein HDU93_009981 [Gonapodya sp. JEL0774]